MPNHIAGRFTSCHGRYRAVPRTNRTRTVGKALQAGLAAGGVARQDIRYHEAVELQSWPERVEPAFKASLDRLGLTYLDLYLIHTPLHLNPGTSRTRGMKTAMSFTTTK